MWRGDLGQEGVACTHLHEPASGAGLFGVVDHVQQRTHLLQCRVARAKCPYPTRQGMGQEAREGGCDRAWGMRLHPALTLARNAGVVLGAAAPGAAVVSGCAMESLTLSFKAPPLLLAGL